jgi:hypothetical protein
MKRNNYTVRVTYVDEEYKEKDRDVWTFSKRDSAYKLINFINELEEHEKDIYVEEWSIGE